MDKNLNKLLVIFAALMVMGCGSRKLNKTNEVLKTTEAEVSKDTTSTKKDIKFKHIEIYTEYEYLTEPIDSTKEMEIDGKKYKNVRFKAVKKDKTTNILKEDKSVTNQSKTIQKAKTVEMKKEGKQIDKKSGFPWWIVIVITLIGGALLYFNYKFKR